MMTAVLLIGLTMLALWSALLWAALSLWQLLADVPWAQALQKLRELPVADWLPPWLGSQAERLWAQWVNAVEPLLHWGTLLLQGSGDWLGSVVPLLLWLLWGAGAGTLLLLTLAGAGGVWWMRRQPNLNQNGQ